jgi:putative transcriptional regulator
MNRGREKMEVKNRLKELRARSNLTQKDLSKKVGVTRQTIVSLEKGTYVPSLLLAMNISEVFQEPIEKIFYKGDGK